jgi:gluconate/galactonate dehydratase
MGILEAKKTAAIADAFGVLVAPHNAFGPVQTAASLNLDYTMTNFAIQESFEESWPDWKKKLLKTGYKLSGGYFTLSGKPGLGIEVDEKILKSKIVDGMEPFDPAEPPWVVSGTFK